MLIRFYKIISRNEPDIVYYGFTKNSVYDQFIRLQSYFKSPKRQNRRVFNVFLAGDCYYSIIDTIELDNMSNAELRLILKILKEIDNAQ